MNSFQDDTSERNYSIYCIRAAAEGGKINRVLRMAFKEAAARMRVNNTGSLATISGMYKKEKNYK